MPFLRSAAPPGRAPSGLRMASRAAIWRSMRSLSAFNVWKQRTDRYSEERLEALNSPEGYRPKEHRKIEMITLGG